MQAEPGLRRRKVALQSVLPFTEAALYRAPKPLVRFRCRLTDVPMPLTDT
jgi:hypothetical protein